MFGIVKRESYLKKLKEEYKNSGSTDTYLEWLEKEYHKTDAYLKHLEEKEAELKRDDMKQFGQFVGLFLSIVSILAFISCIYFNVHYLLWGISLVCLFWGFWTWNYFTNK